MANKSEKEWMSRVAGIGCIVCINEHGEGSPAELHHINSHGVGLRSDNYSVIPLCHAHHRTGGHGIAVHAGKKTWEERFGYEIDLLEQVRELLNA